MALSFACDRGSLEMVKLLLEADVEVNARESFFQADAMVWALNKGHLGIVRLLLERGGRNDERILMTGLERNDLSLERGGLTADTLTASLPVPSARTAEKWLNC